MSEEIFAKVMGFLAEQKAKTDYRQVVKLELGYAPVSFREQQLKGWVREQEPEYFETQALTEKLAGMIVETVTDHADTMPPGKHRYVLRAIQHMGGREQLWFTVSPSMESSGAGDMSMTVAGSSPAATGWEAAVQALTQNNAHLMNNNTRMFQSSFETMANITRSVNDENNALKAENATLRAENEALRHDRRQEEFEREIMREDRARQNHNSDMFQKIVPMIAAKVLGPEGAAAAGASALGQLIKQLKETLRQDQLMQIANLLDSGQQMLFVQILQMVDAPPNENKAAS